MKKIMTKKILIPVFALVILVAGSSFKGDFFEIAKQIEIFTTLFKELNMNYVDETNPAELMDTAIKNMLDDLDPYTKFLNEQDVEAYRINNSGEYSGIGALVRSYDNRLLIIEPYKGYPADKAGLKAGDEILKIGDISIAEYKEGASELLKGAKNTEVEITYLRQGKTNTTTLERAGIDIDAVPYYNMVDPETGYIVLSRFNEKASSQTKSAINDLKGRGAKRLILDLRGNPGGLLSEAIAVCNLFVPKGELIVTTKSKVSKFNREYKTKNQPLDAEIPLAVLIDGSSASASEIVSGGLQDLDRAVVVGARSFGKGLVQRPLKLTYGTQLKVTISRYYTPSGRCIQSLDYWNRDDQGNAVRNTQFRDFKTRNGRKVQDGGGVMPDLEITALKSNDFTKALMANLLIFDFATQYHYQNPMDDLSQFNFQDKDYQSFKSFVSQRGLEFETPVEKALKEAISNPRSDALGAGMNTRYQQLLAEIEKEKLSSLDTYREELEKNLEDEILKRYFYREGLYDYYLENDNAIQVSRELLSDKSRYAGILN
ncbi:S41 family peptidase [Zeaxanthinibacter sp. PT1]|uniref:S41 family peptidase n=1 Tax=Zeaxanthinibacter TaxID=561554 RepID=UPI00234A8475|nr:S41 family peptidase [Zeaxanthinibacter sp. PT1]MDC6350661.1 S41 family peptidase [Zeaxanthinibacter sp. PT1]